MNAPAPAGEGPPLTESLLNWLWLADLPAWDAGLEITGGAIGLEEAMRTHFGRSEACPVDMADAGGLRWPEATFDCIIAHGVLERSVRRWSPAGLRRFLGECHRVLRPGGCLAVGFTNPYRLGRRRAGAAPSPILIHGLPARLIDVGFGTVRKYHIEPRLGRIDSLIPASLPIVRHRLRTRPGSALRRRARHLLARVGNGDLLYPATLALAHR